MVRDEIGIGQGDARLLVYYKEHLYKIYEIPKSPVVSQYPVGLTTQ